MSERKTKKWKEKEKKKEKKTEVKSYADMSLLAKVHDCWKRMLDWITSDLDNVLFVCLQITHGYGIRFTYSVEGWTRDLTLSNIMPFSLVQEVASHFYVRLGTV